MKVSAGIAYLYRVLNIDIPFLDYLLLSTVMFLHALEQLFLSQVSVHLRDGSASVCYGQRIKICVLQVFIIHYAIGFCWLMMSLLRLPSDFA